MFCVNYCRFGRHHGRICFCVQTALIVKFQNITQIRYVYYHCIEIFKLELIQILEIISELCLNIVRIPKLLLN